MKPELQESKIISKIEARELHLVPKEELTPKILPSEKDKEGCNAYFVASQYTQKNQIPLEAYTKEAKIVSMIKARKLHLVPKEDLTPEKLLSAKDERGLNAYFVALQYIQKGKIPPEAYTKEALLSLSPSGRPLVWRLLISADQLPILPDQVTQEILEFRSQEDQETGFHCAAFARTLNRIPAKLLTPKNLLAKNIKGITPLDVIIQRRNNADQDFLRDIPINTIRLLSQMGEIKPENLTEETKKRLFRLQRNQRVIKAQRLIQTPQ